MLRNGAIALRWIGCVLMISGWLLVPAALLLLAGTGQRLGFVVAGLAVIALGVALLAKSYLIPEPEPTERWKIR